MMELTNKTVYGKNITKVVRTKKLPPTEIRSLDESKRYKVKIEVDGNIYQNLDFTDKDRLDVILATTALQVEAVLFKEEDD